MLRLLLSLSILLSILFLPFWISVVLSLIGIFYFSFFWESVFLLFLSDILYGVKEEKLFNIYFFSFVFSLLFLIAIELFKNKLKFYQKK